MKRNLTAVLMASALLALSACDSDDDDDGGATDPTEVVDGTGDGDTDGEGGDGDADGEGGDGDGDGEGGDGDADGEGGDGDADGEGGDGDADGEGGDGDADGEGGEGDADGEGGEGESTAGATSIAGTYQVTFENLTTNQLMTPPVVALHDPSVHLYEVGEPASDAVRDIAETGSNDALVAFAVANPDVVSAAGVVGNGPFFPGGTVVDSFTTELDGQVFSAVNMIICTNDGIVGADSIDLPAGTDPVTITAVAYDAGTRENSDDATSFFPPPCRGAAEVVANAETDPRAPITAHPGQTVVNNNADAPITTDNWDLAAGAEVLRIEIVRN